MSAVVAQLDSRTDPSKGTNQVKRSILVAAVLAIAACKESPSGPAPQTPSVVAITAPQTIIYVASTVTLTASVFDQDGKRIPNAAVVWRTKQPG